MSILIDSTDLKQIQSACEFGWVKGITTNPLLLEQSPMAGKTLLVSLKLLTPGPIFYQLMAQNFEEMLDEAYLVQEILEQQLVLKLPPNDLGFKVCSQLSTKIACCPTAIYSPSQALVARESGAQYIAVYVNRATRLMGDGIKLLRDISTILADSATELLAASLKSPEEAVSASIAGAQHLTLPYETLIQMSKNELSEEAIRQFRDEGVGIGR
ncbi:transaldolase [bacterium]|nr:transaldolase [bacterium]